MSLDHLNQGNTNSWHCTQSKIESLPFLFNEEQAETMEMGLIKSALQPPKCVVSTQ